MMRANPFSSNKKSVLATRQRRLAIRFRAAPGAFFFAAGGVAAFLAAGLEAAEDAGLPIALSTASATG
jgi:hypothetical protein